MLYSRQINNLLHEETAMFSINVLLIVVPLALLVLYAVQSTITTLRAMFGHYPVYIMLCLLCAGHFFVAFGIIIIVLSSWNMVEPSTHYPLLSVCAVSIVLMVFYLDSIDKLGRQKKIDEFRDECDDVSGRHLERFRDRNRRNVRRTTR